MPNFDKISHTSFSVTDAERSAAWWTERFGLIEIERVSGDGWRAIIAVHPPSGTVLEWQQHDDNDGARFSPARTGLDHVGFKVGSLDALDEWQRHFEATDVDHTPVVTKDYGSVLTFRDPDGIQFEMFYREGHP